MYASSLSKDTNIVAASVKASGMRMSPIRMPTDTVYSECSEYAIHYILVLHTSNLGRW
jgi:hypothetical protein